MEFPVIINGILDIYCTISQKECKMLDTTYTRYIVLYYYICVYIYIYTYTRIYKLYILYQIILRAESSGTNECSWLLADLPLIIAYVQDVLENTRLR